MAALDERLQGLVVALAAAHRVGVDAYRPASRPRREPARIRCKRSQAGVRSSTSAGCTHEWRSAGSHAGQATGPAPCPARNLGAGPPLSAGGGLRPCLRRALGARRPACLLGRAGRLARGLRPTLRGSEIVLRVLHRLLGKEGSGFTEACESLACQDGAETGIRAGHPEGSRRGPGTAREQKDQPCGRGARGQGSEKPRTADHRGSCSGPPHLRRHLAPSELDLLAGQDDGLLRHVLYQIVERAIGYRSGHSAGVPAPRCHQAGTRCRRGGFTCRLGSSPAG